MPQENEKDLPDIPDAIKNTMKLHFVDSMDEVLQIALERELVALPVSAVPGVECPGRMEARSALRELALTHAHSARCGLPVREPARRFLLKAEFVVSSGKPERFPTDRLPEVAFLGRSNVGKSSLINALTGQKGLAFTSNTPGRTQTINFYRIDGAFYFVDLPGYGYARVPQAVCGGMEEADRTLFGE